MKISWRGKELFKIEFRSNDEYVSSIKNPRGWLTQVMGNGTSSGISVNSENALTLPVYYGGLKVLSEDIAKIPGSVYKKDGKNRNEIVHPSNSLVYSKPNRVLNSFHWRVSMMMHALSFGNGYSRIIRNGDARPVEFKFFDNNYDVRPHVIDDELWYSIKGEINPVPARDMIHIHGIGYNGVEGKGLLQVGKEIIGGGLAAQDYANKNFGGGSLKKVAITIPQAAGPKGIDQNTEDFIKKEWKEAHASNDPMLLPFGMEANEIGLNPEEIKLIETQGFTIQQFSRLARIPLHKLQELKDTHFNNIEHQSVEYVTDSLLPWVIQWEMELNDKTLKESEKGRVYHKWNINSLMRGDLKTRSEFYHAMKLDGNMTGNEIRALEDMNPIPECDTIFTPVNVFNDDLLEAQTKKVLEEIKKTKNNGN